MSSNRNTRHLPTTLCGLLLAWVSACFPALIQAEPTEGMVLPSKQVTLNAPLPSILKELTVLEGDHVQQGQTLAQMDDGLQRVAVRSAELQATSSTAIDNAQLVLEDAQIQVERIKEAEANDAASEWEVRRTQLQAEQAAAQLKQAYEQQELAKIQLDLERQRLERYTVLAPFTGRVLRTEAEAGASLTQQDPLLTLVAIHPLEAHFHLPSSVYGSLSVGESYELQAGSDRGEAIPATLKTIDPVIDPASQTFRVVFEIANQDESRPAGFPIWFEFDSQDAQMAENE